MFNDRSKQQYGQNRNNETADQDLFKENFFIEGKLNPNWVGENARRLSLRITEGRSGMGATSMRNFYNEFLRIKNIPSSRADEKLIQIKLLKAKTNYKHKVQQATNLHNSFVKFINKLLEEIGNDLGRFDVSCFVFEALIGYADKR